MRSERHHICCKLGVHDEPSDIVVTGIEADAWAHAEKTIYGALAMAVVTSHSSSSMSSDDHLLSGLVMVAGFVVVWRRRSSGSSLPLIFCIYVRSGPIYWGGYLPCKNIYMVMVFYM